MNQKNRICAFLAGVLGLFPAIIFASHSEIHFAEPYTGKRVSSYQVELRVLSHHKETFQVPSECKAVARAFAGGADQWGSKLERALWPKVVNDCRYVRVTHTVSAPDITDHVSGYDFFNTQIAAFPMRWGCQYADLATVAECERSYLGVPDVSRLPAFQQGTPDDKTFTEAACQLKNGVFRGQIYYGSSGIFCKQDRRGVGFRILSVDFADVNLDGYMDAIIRLIPIGRSVSRVPILYMVTRYGVDAAFSPVPE